MLSMAAFRRHQKNSVIVAEVCKPEILQRGPLTKHFLTCGLAGSRSLLFHLLLLTAYAVDDQVKGTLPRFQEHDKYFHAVQMSPLLCALLLSLRLMTSYSSFQFQLQCHVTEILFLSIHEIKLFCITLFCKCICQNLFHSLLRISLCPQAHH